MLRVENVELEASGATVVEINLLIFVDVEYLFNIEFTVSLTALLILSKCIVSVFIDISSAT